MAESTLYLVRHARPDFGSGPAETWPLSEEGRQQASRLAELEFWSEVYLICSSPEPKALQTAQIVAQRHDLAVEPVFDLRELRRPAVLVGDYDAVVEEALSRPAASVQGWEPAGEAQTRIKVAVERLLQLHEDKTLAIVSHGLVLTLYVAQLTGAPADVVLWKSIPMASAVQVDVEGGRIVARHVIGL